MAMITKSFQAKYAVSYTTINAFVPDRTPRCEVLGKSVILIMACEGTDDHHQRIDQYTKNAITDGGSTAI